MYIYYKYVTKICSKYCEGCSVPLTSDNAKILQHTVKSKKLLRLTQSTIT